MKIYIEEADAFIEGEYFPIITTKEIIKPNTLIEHKFILTKIYKFIPNYHNNGDLTYQKIELSINELNNIVTKVNQLKLENKVMPYQPELPF